MALVTDGTEVGNLCLRVPQNPEDLQLLYRLALEMGDRWNWSEFNHSAQTFDLSVRDVFDHYMVLDRSSRVFVGYIAFAGVNLVHGFASVRVYRAQTPETRPDFLVAVRFLLDAMFRVTPVRNVYAEMTPESLAELGLQAFDSTAVLPGKFIIDGRPTDQIICGISRDHWNRLSQRWERLRAR